MKFPTLFAVAVLATGAVANEHFRMVCKKDGIFDAGSTQSACEEYLKRKTGSEKYDSCPDCTFVPAPSEDKIPYCESKNWHLGGNEFLAYCKQFGGDEAQDLDLSLSRKRFHA